MQWDIKGQLAAGAIVNDAQFRLVCLVVAIFYRGILADLIKDATDRVVFVKPHRLIKILQGGGIGSFRVGDLQMKPVLLGQAVITHRSGPAFRRGS